MKNIIMVCTSGDSSRYIYNNVSKDFDITEVIIVGQEDKKTFLKRRVKKLGILKVIGQILFVAYTKIFLKTKSESRIKEIEKLYRLDNEAIPKNKVTNIESVNSEEMKMKLRNINPDIVIVNGTPIIKKEILNTIEADFVNIHVGITPKYRGVHGGYWALYNNDYELAGVTTHFIDEGIDSGEVIDQKLISPTKKDNFLTYPSLQLAMALSNYNDNIYKVLHNEIKEKSSITTESKLWTHPTIFHYFYGRIFKSVK